MRSNINSILNDDPEHLKVFNSRRRLILFYGGTGAGKTYTIADKILILSVRYPSTKFLVVRKTLPSLRKSCIEILERRAKVLKVPFDLNKSSYTAKVGNNSSIDFVSMNNPVDYEKIKSMTDIDFIWVEEATELTADAYEELKRRLRGGKGMPFSQMILSFNPVGTFNWVYNFFFVKRIDDPYIVKVTVENNKFVDKFFKDGLRSTQKHNENIYRIYYLGEWGNLEGLVFTNFDIVDMMPMDRRYQKYSGLDFGFSVSVASVVSIYQAGDEVWLEEKIYEAGLTNPALAQRMDQEEIPRDEIIFADSEDPKSIRELQDLGFSCIYPTEKGPDSVRARIDFAKSLKIHILSNSPNVIKEFSSLCYQKNSSGEYIPKPVKFNDHSVDASTYGIYGYNKKFGYLQNFKPTEAGHPLESYNLEVM